jgi:hypothetical protein
MQTNDKHPPRRQIVGGGAAGLAAATAFSGTQAYLRSDIDKVEEPKLKAMFETSAEVLAGLSKAFADYKHKSEAAWRPQA